MELHLMAYYIGIIIIFATHLRMLMAGGFNANMTTSHAVINLIAGSLIAYYFMNKENMIKA
jgi:hypothetical protein